jgi:hypothetical protein
LQRNEDLKRRKVVEMYYDSPSFEREARNAFSISDLGWIV